jgi:AI-2 transport protein TqsA
MMTEHNIKLQTGWMIQLAAVVVVLAAARAAGSILVPLLLVIYIAILCAPMVQWLAARGCNRTLAVGLVVVAFIGIVLAIFAALGNSVSQFMVRREFYQERLTEWVDTIIDQLSHWGVDTKDFDLKKVFDPGLVLQSAGAVLSNLGDVLSNSFLILMGVIFLLLDVPELVARLANCPMPGGRPLNMAPLFHKINHYMALKAWYSLMTAVSVTIGLKIVGVEFALLWGVLAFLLDFIPNIGSIIAAVPPILLALVQLGPWPAAVVAGIYLAVNMVIGNVLEPRLIGRGLGLSSSMVLLSLVLWGWLLGPLGMFLAMPLTIAVKLALESSPDTVWIAAIMGDVESASFGPVAAILPAGGKDDLPPG